MCRKGAYFSDPSLEQILRKFNELGSVVFTHPMGYDAPVDGRFLPVIEVAFEITLVVTDMMYWRLPSTFPDTRIVLTHSSGALPHGSGRLELVGAESWVPNKQGVSKNEVKDRLKGSYTDTAAIIETGLAPAVKMCGMEHVLYGADCGDPCSTDQTMNINKASVSLMEEEMELDRNYMSMKS